MLYNIGRKGTYYEKTVFSNIGVDYTADYLP